MNGHDPDDDRALENDPLYFTTGPTRFQTPDEYIASTIREMHLVDINGRLLARAPYVHGQPTEMVAIWHGAVAMCWLVDGAGTRLIAVAPNMDNRHIMIDQHITMRVDSIRMSR